MYPSPGYLQTNRVIHDVKLFHISTIQFFTISLNLFEYVNLFPTYKYFVYLILQFYQIFFNFQYDIKVIYITLKVAPVIDICIRSTRLLNYKSCYGFSNITYMYFILTYNSNFCLGLFSENWNFIAFDSVSKWYQAAGNNIVPTGTLSAKGICESPYGSRCCLFPHWVLETTPIGQKRADNGLGSFYGIWIGPELSLFRAITRCVFWVRYCKISSSSVYQNHNSEVTASTFGASSAAAVPREKMSHV